MSARLAVRAVSFAALAYLVLPLAVIVGSSLTATSYLAFPPQSLTLAWYGRVLGDSAYLAAFRTSTLLALAATAGAVVLAVPAALGIARYRFPGRAILAALLTSPLILPQIVLGAALLQFGSLIGLTRSFAALLVGHVVVVTPFVLRAVLPHFTPEQRALEEASADLGASPLTTFARITLPQIRGGLVSGSLLAFISSWINVELSLFNTTADLMTVPVRLFNDVQYTIDPSLAAISAITIGAAVIVILALDLTFGLDVLSERR